MKLAINKSLIVILFMFSVNISFAQDTEDKKPALELAKATTETPKTPESDIPYAFYPNPVSLGKMPYGSRQEFSVRVLNRGEKPLTIKKVRSSCACLKLKDFDKEEIKPGTHAFIRGIMIADKKEGETRKLFYVHISDKMNPIAQIIINVQFVKAEGATVVLSNNALEFGRLDADGEKRLSVVRIMNFGDTPLKISEIINPLPEALTLKLDNQDEVAPHKGVTLRAWIDPIKIKTWPVEEEAFIVSNALLSSVATLKIMASKNVTTNSAKKNNQ